MTQAQFSEQQFMKWVRFVGRLKHSVFKTAKNKLFPSYTLHVAKNRAAGDFTTIQDAIDSLPFINLLRVVIKVHAGVYTLIVGVSASTGLKKLGRRFGCIKQFWAFNVPTFFNDVFLKACDWHRMIMSKEGWAINISSQSQSGDTNFICTPNSQTCNGA
ncbi:hypothetical protein L3X38_023569 [Prunus dulcis]|nr:hypothetical protein L3X38_023569 [Prunus dulcis]